MFILLYANCVVMYCVSFDVVVGNKRYLILSYLILIIVIVQTITRGNDAVVWRHVVAVSCVVYTFTHYC